MNRIRPFAFLRNCLAAAACFTLLAAALTGCGGKEIATGQLQTAPAERRSITLTVEATGTVEPINLVEVKSKASGQIVRMPVEIGTAVRTGDLLVQVDPRDVQNAFDQAQAALTAAQARAEVGRLQRERADRLFAEQVITATEHEAATLDDANAKSQLVAARTNLDIAQQRLEDATVRAPIEGTVLEKPVSVGQVISSATSSVSGGTTLLKMADLDRVRMRALVVETDIGQVKPGQNVNVVVDAYPQRTFRGEVEKIEPQAQIQQSVTMFPVLISISNEDKLLLPGMNGEVTMLVAERPDALTVPVDAIRSMRDMPGIAEALGMNVDSLRSQMRGRLRGGADGPAAAGRPADDARGGNGPPAGGGTDAAFTGAQRDSMREAEMQNGGPDSATRAQWRARRGGAGDGRGAGAGAGGASGRPGGGGGGSGGPPQFAVVKTANGYAPRFVRIGISDYDNVEIVSGLDEGDEVLLLGVVQMSQEREALQDRIRSRVGGGVTQQNSNNNRSGGGR